MDSLIEIMSPLGQNLLIRQVSGEEGLGRLFEFRLDLLSPKSELDPDDLLGQLVTIKLGQSDDSARHFNGHVTRIEQTGHDGRYFTSQAVLRPWLWFLTRKTDCRIHQDLTVPEILKLVFDEYPDIAVVEFRLSGEYRKWEYCVQYRESDFNFVSRLMEHEGIYYYFDHGSGGHKLVLVDAYSAHKEVKGFEKLAYYAEAPRGRAGVEYVQQWRHAQDFRSGQYATRDYDFKQPQKSVHATKTNTAPPALSEAEVFDYPGGYIENPHGEQYAEVRLAELQTGYESASGSSNSRSLYVGSLFTLNNHPTAKRNAQYLVTRMSMHATHPAYEASNAGEGGRFGCSFSVVPGKQQFRPRRSTQKPVMQGPQTAVVVGADGDEIYVDSFGRVKVRFHWDRHEPKDNKEENRSCWIRVSQAMAGKNWGFVSIPRVKQEVIVDFIEGDPDQPIITGRVYNGDQMPPYELPGNATQTGLKTRSSKGGSPANFNEIRFEDKKGSEQVYIHAEKDKSVNVENDDATTVGHDQTLSVGNDQTTTVKRDQKLTVSRDRTVYVEKNETHTVDLAQKIKVGSGQFTEVTGLQSTLVTGDRTVTVTGNSTALTTLERVENIGQNELVKVGGNQNIEVTGNLDYKAKRMVFEAEHIEYKVTGANSVKHEALIGPYEIMANEYFVQSNTDATIFAAGAINNICMKHNVTTMGPDETSCIANTNVFKVGMSNEVSLAIKSSLTASIEMDTKVAITSGTFVGGKIEATVGFSMSFGALKQYLPPSAAAGPAGKDAIKAGTAIAAGKGATIAAATIPTFLGWYTALAVLGAGQRNGSEDNAKKRAENKTKQAEARKQALMAAQRALAAGKPALAFRILGLSGGNTEMLGMKEFAGSMTEFPESAIPTLQKTINDQLLENSARNSTDPSLEPSPQPSSVVVPDQKPAPEPEDDPWKTPDDSEPPPSEGADGEQWPPSNEPSSEAAPADAPLPADAGSDAPPSEDPDIIYDDDDGPASPSPEDPEPKP